MSAPEVTVRFEHLFDAELWYVDEGAWAYGEREAVGYGEGEGNATGRAVSGTLRWTNRPFRREDGVWFSEIDGFIQTADDARVLIRLRGRSLPETEPGDARDVVCSATFRSSDVRYRWLDSVIAIVEARHDAEHGRILLRAYECRNELPARLLG